MPPPPGKMVEQTIIAHVDTSGLDFNVLLTQDTNLHVFIDMDTNSKKNISLFGKRPQVKANVIQVLQLKIKHIIYYIYPFYPYCHVDCMNLFHVQHLGLSENSVPPKPNG